MVPPQLLPTLPQAPTLFLQALEHSSSNVSVEAEVEVELVQAAMVRAVSDQVVVLVRALTLVS